MNTLKYFDVMQELILAYPGSKLSIGTLVFYKDELYVIEPGFVFGELRLTPVIKDTSRADISLT